MHVDTLTTPCLLVDRTRLDRNIQRMQKKAEANNVTLRPHIKTHKSIAIARRQQEAGADGITTATVAEAETFVAAGFDDVRIAYDLIGRDAYERVQALRGTACLSFCIDTPSGANAAASFFANHEPIDVLMEVDVGHGRCGVPWANEQETVDLARHIAQKDSLRLAGILTHAGQAYGGPEENETEAEALQRVSRQERDRMLAVAARLHDAGVPGVVPDDFTVSIGSTPSMRYFENQSHGDFTITEIRPGNYVFYDAMQAALGAATLADCALHVGATVVSKRDHPGGSGRFYLDAGKKVMTTDTGYGLRGHGVIPRASNGVTIHRLSEEHAWGQAAGAVPFDVGDRVRVVPNHACVTVDTQDTLHVVEDDEVVDAWSVDA